MSRVGDSIAVANPPPLPPPEVAESSSAGALRGPKMGSKGRSRTRDSGTPTQQVGSRGGDGDSAPPSERDSPIEPARRDSPIEHGEAPHTPVNGAFVTNASLHTSGGAPKAARRLRDTTAINAAVSDERPPVAAPSPSSEASSSRDRSNREGSKRRSAAAGQDASSPDPSSNVPVAVAEPEVVSWLAQQGLMCYKQLFAQHHVTSDLLLELDNEALEKIGVHSWGHRCVLLRAVAVRRKDLAVDSGAMQSQEQEEGAMGGLRGARKRGGERDKSSAVGGVAVSGPAGSSSHGSLKDVYDQMENMKIHFESQMEQLNRELQTLKAGLHSSSLAGSAQRGGAGGKGSKGVNGGVDGGGEHGKRGAEGGGGGGEKGSGGGGGGAGGGGGKNGHHKGGGKKEVDHNALADTSSNAVGIAGTQGYAYGGHQGMMTAGHNAAYMPGNAGMAYGGPMYSMLPPGAAQMGNLAYLNMAMMQGGMGGYDASAQYYIQPGMQGVLSQEAYGAYGGADPGQMVQSAGLEAGGAEMPEADVSSFEP